MIVLDENILRPARERLRGWRIRFRHIGTDLSHKGADDQAHIIPLLHGLTNPTFFSGDRDFYRRGLRHRRYCVVFLDVVPSDHAAFIRRFLRHPNYRTFTQRQGSVVHVGYAGVRAWRLNADAEEASSWPDESD